MILTEKNKYKKIKLKIASKCKWQKCAFIPLQILISEFAHLCFAVFNNCKKINWDWLNRVKR